MNNNVINKQKLASYNVFLAILVVLIHTDNTYSFVSLSDKSFLSTFTVCLEWLVSKNIASFAVPSFFMISGILFYRDFTVKKYPQKLKSRLFSLIIPFFVWNLLRFFLFYGLGKIGITQALFNAPRVLFTKENFLEGLLFYKFNLGFWFMYQLILFTVLAPVIRIIVKNKWLGLIAILSLIGVYSADIFGNFLIVTMEKKFILLDCLIYYMAGAYIGTHFFNYVNRSDKTTKILSVCGILLGQALNYAFIKSNILLFYIMFLIISAISLWYFFDLLNLKSLPVALTSITFFIYAGQYLNFCRR